MKRTIKLFLFLALALSLCLTLAGCGAKNLGNFQKVQPGWTTEQVRELLGEPDEVKQAAGLAAFWKYESKGPFGDGSRLIVNSLGGKVVLATIDK